MKYISYRKLTHVSLTGGSVEFEKGVPTYAPPRMHHELIALGVVPEEHMEEPAVADPAEPVDPSAREVVLFELFDTLTTRGRREDFTAVGAPHAAVIAKELGWSTINAKERDATWSKWTLLQLEKAD